MNLSPDIILDLIHRLTKTEGLTRTEARQHFDDKPWNAAIHAALDLGGLDHPLFQWGVKQSQEEGHEDCLESQCYALWIAGWTTEDNGRAESWAWYWRRPARGNRAKGRLYLSTNQAYNALQRER